MRRVILSTGLIILSLETGGFSCPPGGQEHWAKNRVVHYNLNGVPAEYQPHLRAAFNSYTQQSSSNNSGVSFVEDGNDYAVSFDPDLDNHRAQTAIGIDGSGVVVWASTSIYNGSDHTYVDATAPGYTDFLYKAMLHEIGHTFGLGHANDPPGNTVMNGMVGVNDISGNMAFGLTECDRQAVVITYFSPPPPRDDDGDGHSPEDAGGDCNDSDPNVWENCEQYYCVQGGFQRGPPCLNDTGTPIIVDVLGDGFNLTNRPDGVRFDLNNDGYRELLPWTASGVDDAWLVLDRDGDGLISNGPELFGNFTPQPPTAEPNGFIALAVFDGNVSGGNSDGWIDKTDAMFTRLQLWQDVNHNAISESSELRSLEAVGIERISMEYRENRRQDRWGNWFRYRAKLVDTPSARFGPWTYDVILRSRPRQ